MDVTSHLNQDYSESVINDVQTARQTDFQAATGSPNSNKWTALNADVLSKCTALNAKELSGDLDRDNKSDGNLARVNDINKVTVSEILLVQLQYIEFLSCLS